MSEDKTQMEAGKRALLSGLSQEDTQYFVLMSGCTREPYVQCDPETFDDETMVFLEEDAARAKAKELADARIPVVPTRLQSRQMLSFFTSLFTMGINALRICYQGEESSMQLDDIVKRKEKKDMPDGSVWVENPQLHLTALYFAQELRRPMGPDTKDRLMELQEEMSADFKRGSFIFALHKDGKGTPMVKMKNGQKYQPVFTDVMEFVRFNREKEFRPVVVGADKLLQALDNSAAGVILNCMGVNIPLAVGRPVKPAPSGAPEAAGTAPGAPEQPSGTVAAGPAAVRDDGITDGK